MKFLADMGISPRVVEELRQQGHEAIHLLERRLNRMVDGDILQMAQQEGRVLLTNYLPTTYQRSGFWRVIGREWRSFTKRHHLSSQRHAPEKRNSTLGFDSQKSFPILEYRRGFKRYRTEITN